MKRQKQKRALQLLLFAASDTPYESSTAPTSLACKNSAESMQFCRDMHTADATADAL